MKRALIIQDLQNDFLFNGALAVPKGDEIIHPINQIIEHFDWVLAVKDWHPKEHISFAETWNKEVGEVQEINGVKQTLWPVHCVENTHGSKHPDNFDSDHVHRTFYKGVKRNVDSYSVFFDQNKDPATPISTFLMIHQIVELYFVGVATEYCVKSSVVDALSLGYKTFLVTDCCRSIDPVEGEAALALMEKKGAHLIQSAQIKEGLVALK